MTVRSLKVTAYVILMGGRRQRISSGGDFIQAKILRGIYPEPRVEILRGVYPEILHFVQNDNRRTHNDRKRRARITFIESKMFHVKHFFLHFCFLKC